MQSQPELAHLLDSIGAGELNRDRLGELITSHRVGSPMWAATRYEQDATDGDASRGLGVSRQSESILAPNYRHAARWQFALPDALDHLERCFLRLELGEDGTVAIS